MYRKLTLFAICLMFVAGFAQLAAADTLNYPYHADLEEFIQSQNLTYHLSETGSIVIDVTTMTEGDIDAIKSGIQNVARTLEFQPPSNTRDTGGPDTFGYTFDDCLVYYDFEDISAVATEVSLGDDAMSSAAPIGFTFNFYGVDYTDVYISSNGFISFLSGQDDGCCSGEFIPDSGSPNAIIAAWWEDFDPPETNSIIRYATVGTAPDRRFIVEFNNVGHWSNGNNPATWQIKLFETSNDIEIHYTEAGSDGGTHTVGIENEDGTDGLLYQQTSQALPSFSVIRFDYPPADGVTATDTDNDGIGDPCDNCIDTPNPDQLDCNLNGVGDVCELADDPTLDCNGNNIPDECDLADGTSADCNGNDIPDECEIADDPTLDCNNNLVIDACELSNQCGALYAGDYNDPELEIVDPTTGYNLNTVFVTIPDGPQVNRFHGLVTHPTTGELYAVMREGSSGGTRADGDQLLVTIESTTGIATVIGNLNTNANMLDSRIAAIAFDLNGNLFGVTGPAGSNPNTLYQIDPTNGTTTIRYAFDANDSQHALALNTSDELLYHITWSDVEGAYVLQTIDVTDPANPVVSTINNNFQTSYDPLALTYSPCEQIFYYADDDCSLYQMDTNGNSTYIGSTPCNKGLAFEILPPAVSDCIGGTANGIPDDCEPGFDDVDGDNWHAECDNCPDIANSDQADQDQDGVGDACDVCPNAFDPDQTDTDNDGLGDVCDNCIDIPNAEQTDCDGNGIGDVCEIDADPGLDCNDDGILDACQVTRSCDILYAVENGYDVLIELDPATGLEISQKAIRVVGAPLQIDGFNGMAMDPIAELIYVVLRDNFGDRYLATLDPDPTPAEATIIGSLDHNFSAIAFDALGNLFGISGTSGSNPNSFLQIDTSDASTTLIDGVNANGGHALAFNSVDGLFYHLTGSGGTTLSTIEVSFVPLEITETDIATGLGYGDPPLALTHCPETNTFHYADYWCRTYTMTPTGNMTPLAEQNCYKGLVFQTSPSIFDCDENGVIDVCEGGADGDGDGIADLGDCDNCPGVFNPDQADCDDDGVGDACELDVDNDGVPNDCDNCELANPDQADCDGNGIGDTCDIATGLYDDCQPNGIPDVCDLVFCGDIYAVYTTESFMHTLDAQTGQVLSTVPLSSTTIFGNLAAQGLAQNPITGELWAIAGDGDPRYLATIDPVTGVVDEQGAMLEGIANLTFDSDGTLYTTHARNSVLYEVSTDGQATLTYLMDLTPGRGHAIQYNPNDGFLYHATSPNYSGALTFERIDLTTLTVDQTISNDLLGGDFKNFGLTHCPTSDLFYLTVFNDGQGGQTRAEGDVELYSLTTAGVTNLLGILNNWGPRGIAMNVISGGSFDENENDIPDECESLDYGDAPPPFPTLSVDNGAAHGLQQGVYLGQSVDEDPNGQPDANYLGDDNLDGSDDEDGVALPASFTPGTNATIQVTVSVDGYLNAWIDYNGNGDWSDAGEQIATDLPLTQAGSPHNLTVTVPAAAVPGMAGARFRFTSYDPNGALSFTGPAADGEVEDYMATINSPFNDPPVHQYNGEPIPDETGAFATVNEDGVLTFNTANNTALSLNDPDSGLLNLFMQITVTNGTVKIYNLNGVNFYYNNGTASLGVSAPLAVLNQALQDMTYTPNPGYSGPATLTIYTTDNGHTGTPPPPDNPAELTDEDIVYIDVLPINDPPVNTVPKRVATFEDTPLTLIGATGISINDSDADAEDLTVTLTVVDGTLEVVNNLGNVVVVGNTTASVAITGTLVNLNAALAGVIFTPTLDFNGSTSITVQTDDLGHTGNGGSQLDTDTIPVTVFSVNDPPEITAPAEITTDEDVAYPFATGELSVLDADAGANIIDMQISMEHGTFSLGTTADLTFVTGDGVDDDYMYFQGTIAAFNAALEGASYTPDANFCDPANDPDDQIWLWIEDRGYGRTTETTSSGFGSASDGSDALSKRSEQAPTFGNASGRQPEGDARENSRASTTATINVIINPVNDPPVAVGDQYTLLEDQSLNVSAPGVLANDTDPNDNPPDALNAVIDTPPTHATSFVLNADGSFDYEPEEDWSGVDQFTYHASDGLPSNVVTVTITVVPVNDEPTFTLSGNPPTVDESSGPQAVSGFAQNIMPGPATATDEAGQNLTFYLDVITTTGNFDFTALPAIDAATGDLTYEVAASTNGTATVEVYLMDDGGTANGGDDTSSIQTFIITVEPVNEPCALLLPAVQNIQAGIMTPIPGIEVSDPDVDEYTGELEIVLEVSSGELTIDNGTTWATSLTLTGTPANLNTALQSLAYQTSGCAPDILDVTLYDEGDPADGTDDQQATGSVDLLVEDTAAPEAMCINPLTVDIDDTGEATLDPTNVDDGSYDDCGGAVTLELYRLTPSPCGGGTDDGTSVVFTCSDVGNVIEVELVVTDAAGNSSSCISEVTVNDPNGYCVPCTGSGTTVTLNLPGRRATAISPPVNLANPTVGDVFSMLPNKLVYTRNCNGTYRYLTDADVLESGVGYFVRTGLYTTVGVDFIGCELTTPVQIERCGTWNGFMTGNPFPYPLDVSNIQVSPPAPVYMQVFVNGYWRTGINPVPAGAAVQIYTSATCLTINPDPAAVLLSYASDATPDQPGEDPGGDTVAQTSSRDWEYRLEQSTPNPFTHTATIRYQLPVSQRVKLDVFNVAGQLIRTLVDSDVAAGDHEITWDGTNANGESVNSGVYFYRLTTNDFSETKRMVLMR